MEQTILPSSRERAVPEIMVSGLTHIVRVFEPPKGSEGMSDYLVMASNKFLDYHRHVRQVSTPFTLHGSLL